jgi:tetratricopeptide (TPR) repeat protein
MGKLAMIRRIVVLVLVPLVAASALAAQAADGDRLWAAGEQAQARAAYERELAQHPGNVHALYRLGVLASWRGDLDSALSLAARARAVEPGDPDVRLLEAQVHAWQGDLAGAQARYDSVIAEYPDRADAKVGRARVRFWQGHGAEADAEVQRILASDPSNADAAALERDIHAARRAYVEVGADWNHDSDDNTSWRESVRVTAPVTDRVALFAGGGLQQSTDPVRSAHREMAEGGVRVTSGVMSITAAAGAQHLSPDGGTARTEATWRGMVTARAVSRVTIAGSFAHHAFDETAQLIGSGLDMDEAEGTIEAGLTRTTTVTVGGGGAWFSDDNQRYHVLAALMQQMPGHFFVGAYGRQMGYDFKGTGYFSPDRFRLLEGRAGWAVTMPAWVISLSGGLGVQEAFRGAETQAEWHGDAAVGRKWGAGNRVDVFGGISNSLERSATGAYRCYNAGVRVTMGL